VKVNQQINNVPLTPPLAFYLSQHGDAFEAIRMLKILTQNNPADADAAQLLKQLSGGE